MSKEIDLLEKMATPSRIGMYIGKEVWGADWVPYPFTLDMERELLDAVMSEDDRFVMVNLPPQSGKSTFMCLLIFWFIGMFPDKQVIFITYSDDYSRTWGGLVRDLMIKYGMELFGLQVDSQRDSATDWSCKGHTRGGMLSVGIGSQITGRSGDLVVTDDVIKNMEEAGSATTKRKHMRDWDGTIITRRQPGCTYVVSATRFATDDLSGSLWDRTQRAGYKGDRWVRCIYPAIATDEDDRLGREIGEPLQCRFSRPTDTIEKSHFVRLRDTIDPFTFDALYQQNPDSSEDGMFPPDKWVFMLRENWPDQHTVVRGWDTAATEGGGDWTVGAKVGRTFDGDLIFDRPYRERHSSDVVLVDMKNTARMDTPAIPILIEQEKSGAGKTNVGFYEKELRGYNVIPTKADGTKEQRAHPYSTMQKSGRCILPLDPEDEEWVKLWVDEHKKMMGDGRKPTHDDQIDAASHCVRYLIDREAVNMLDPNDPDLELGQLLEFEKLLETMGY